MSRRVKVLSAAGVRGVEWDDARSYIWAGTDDRGRASLESGRFERTRAPEECKNRTKTLRRESNHTVGPEERQRTCLP